MTGGDAVTGADRAEDPAVALYQCGFSIRTIAPATGRGVKKVRRILVDAGVVLKPPGSARHVSGSAVAALPEGAAAQIARRLLAEEAQARAAWRPSDPDGADSWRSRLLAALEAEPSVELVTVATRQLGRLPLPAELRAVRRASRQLVDEGLVDLHRFGRGPGAGRLIVTRPGVTPPRPDESPTPAAATPNAGASAAAARFTIRVQNLLRAARRIDAAGVDPVTRTTLVTTLDQAIAQLCDLRDQLGAGASSPNR